MRLNIFPDGGVARLRVYGEAAVDWRQARARAARGRSGGDPQRRPRARRERHALRREGQHDHARPREEHGRRLGNAPAARARARLGHRAARRAGHDRRASRSTPITSRATIPDSASLEGCFAPGRDARCAGVGHVDRAPAANEAARRIIGTSSRRSFVAPVPVSHVRLNIFPDGGISRLRVHGTVAHGLIGAAEAEARGAAADALRIDALGRARCWRGARSATCRALLRGRARGVVRTLRSRLARSLQPSPEDRRSRCAAPALRRDAPSLRAGTGRRRRRAGRRARRRSPSATAHYEERFGYIFIVCATGPQRGGDAGAASSRGSATSPDDEIRIAAEEQAKITAIRLSEDELVTRRSAEL